MDHHHYKKKLQRLYELYLRDEASAAEVKEFWDLLKQYGAESLGDAGSEIYHEPPVSATNKNWDGALERILGHEHKGKSAPVRRWLVAASVAVLVGVSGFLYLNREPAITAQIPEDVLSQPASHDVSAPKGNQAVIILADGSKILLDSTFSGKLAVQNDVALIKTKDGKIRYAGGGGMNDKPVAFNTLVNPRGSQVVDLLLSDGTHLWLNAGSSVQFPVVFRGNTRKVVITGEAYFEVAHDASRQFVVEANGVQTEVFGTHFNINAYDDEDATRVTLLEGRVRVVSPNGESLMIRPGEQAVQSAGLALRLKRGVDVAEVMAWKNQMFRFHDTNIRSIMNEVARWYDVDINYQGGLAAFANLNFGGSMSRQKNVSELLRRLEATEAVRFQVSGRKIDVIRLK